jgi:cytochrome b subunit of formate dehydrogenase
MALLTRRLQRAQTVRLGLGIALFLAGGTAFGQQEEVVDCSACHEEQSKKLAAGAHVPVGCANCHPKHESYPHPEGTPKTQCASCHSTEAGDFARGIHGQERLRGNTVAPDCAVCHGDVHETSRTHTAEFRKAVPDTCGMCHSEIADQFRASVHGTAVARGDLQAAVCTDCHGEHSILPHGDRSSTVSTGRIRETCGRCHGDMRLSRRFGLPADRLTTFDASFHGLAAKAGSQSVASCASCHGYHDILPSTDAKSRVAPANLARTCGQCHEGAGSRFALGTIHAAEGRDEVAAVRVVRNFYLFLIPALIGIMLLHHGGDWIRKLAALRLSRRPRPAAPAQPSGEIRMFPFERLQHALLAVSFGVLVWTGFALKYPEQWWAWPLVAWESRWPVRGIVHRTAGVVLIAVAIVHLLSLILNRGLRRHWISLLPGRRDVVEGARSFSYNLGMGARRPPVSSHSYIEKLEYWAVVWGTLVMALTGVMLWANTLMLRWLPKSWLDVATSVHFYEAVLASLAILVWHFYSVIFDPEVYPMDTAWLTGVSVRRRSPGPSVPAVQTVPIEEESEHESQPSALE